MTPPAAAIGGTLELNNATITAPATGLKLGNGATVNASNKVRIGNTAVKSIGGQVGWTAFSDGRYKKDIKENVPGLVFINSLRPITYKVNVKGLDEYYQKKIKIFDRWQIFLLSRVFLLDLYI